MKRLSRLFLVFALPAAAMLITSCATQPRGSGPARITKVKTYHLQPGMDLQTQDQMIRFEYQHRMHGAITTEDYAARYGNYYTVFWKNENKGANLTLRLEYTQANTGAEVKTREIALPGAGGRGTSEFQIIGEDYATNGPVNAWKVSLLQGDQVIDENKSFLWK